MTIHFQLIPLLSLVAGICILILPRMQRFIIGSYLIAIGIIGLIR